MLFMAVVRYYIIAEIVKSKNNSHIIASNKNIYYNNVNIYVYTWLYYFTEHYDVSVIINNLDFVILGAYDF